MEISLIEKYPHLKEIYNPDGSYNEIFVSQQILMEEDSNTLFALLRDIKSFGQCIVFPCELRPGMTLFWITVEGATTELIIKRLEIDEDESMYNMLVIYDLVDKSKTDGEFVFKYNPIFHSKEHCENYKHDLSREYYQKNSF